MTHQTRLPLPILLLLFAAIGVSLVKAEELPKSTEPTVVQTAHFAEVLAGDAPNSLGELRALEKRVQEVAKKVIPCTVGVSVGGAQGSGVIVTEDGYVMTAGHVIGEPNREAVITLPSGKKVKAITLGTDRSIDSGLLKITTPGKYEHLKIDHSDELRDGQWVLVTGHPGGYVQDRLPVLRLGRVLASYEDVVATDCVLVGGDSGGPLLDMDGDVVGINSRIGNRITANMHVPSDAYSENWNRLTSGEVWGKLPGTRPVLGVRCDKEKKAPIVIEVTPNSPAERSGVQVGDRIVRFNGRETKSFDELKLLVDQTSPGDQVEMVVERGERTLTLNDVVIKDAREIDG
ncbi:S1C family serine protease [Blastopirellula sp. JC732]|uniref:S1C family serine protease n=1 Tax=Blastopirellula sediminis TaxID=2894196 RepID=A0A9X1MR67_9BACT|nr:trypsin-like peptidase domain-containing protein [Blastopirellula sediminis]MCC9605800.1 S1C family serine protease [Blastopirellula sediminis]MCC9630900.1 S1C family serine protease [Blastopirellula sediminis]